jgi:hypothetical protein
MMGLMQGQLRESIAVLGEQLLYNPQILFCPAFESLSMK